MKRVTRRDVSPAHEEVRSGDGGKPIKGERGGVVRVPAVRQGSKERIENRVIRPNNKKKVMKDHGN